MKNKNRNPDRIPGWIWVLSTVLLSLAVLIGLVAFVVQMGYFDPDFSLTEIPTNIVQTQTDDTQPDQEETVVEPLPSNVCTDLAVSQQNVILEEEGARVFLTAIASPSDCDDEIIYTSSDETVATVDGSGIITAVAPGVAEITITCGKIVKTCEVVCEFTVEEEEPMEEDTEETAEEETEETTEETEQEQQVEEPEQPAPSVTPEDFTLFYPGEVAYLSLDNVPEGAAVSYVSGNGGVVSVTNTGKVTAVGSGQTTITITVGDEKLSCIARCNFDSTTEG